MNCVPVIPALILATPCPDCGAAIGQPCRVANPAPIPPGVDPGSVRECCAGRPPGEQGRPDQLFRRGLGRSGSR